MLDLADIVGNNPKCYVNSTPILWRVQVENLSAAYIQHLVEMVKVSPRYAEEVVFTILPPITSDQLPLPPIDVTVWTTTNEDDENTYTYPVITLRLAGVHIVGSHNLIASGGYEEEVHNLLHGCATVWTRYLIDTVRLALAQSFKNASYNIKQSRKKGE